MHACSRTYACTHTHMHAHAHTVTHTHACLHTCQCFPCVNCSVCVCVCNPRSKYANPVAEVQETQAQQVKEQKPVSQGAAKVQITITRAQRQTRQRSQRQEKGEKEILFHGGQGEGGKPAASRSLCQPAERQAGQGQRSKEMICLLYTSPSPRDRHRSRMPSSA